MYISLDPFLTYMMSIMSEDSTCVRACADDIGGAFSSISELRKIVPVFRVAQEVAGLQLKLSKCVIVPLHRRCSPHVVELIKIWLAKHIPIWHDFNVCGASKYLGIFLGPSAGATQWSLPLEKWSARAATITDVGASAAIAANLYNTRAVTTMSYVAQLRLLPK